MRISTDPTDPAFVDARPRRVKVNDREIADWQVADEFRRSVILKDGTVVNGSVWIERLPAVEEAQPVAAAAENPATAFLARAHLSELQHSTRAKKRR